jgi:DNA-binding transcriptional LysR family regulator
MLRTSEPQHWPSATFCRYSLRNRATRKLHTDTCRFKAPVAAHGNSVAEILMAVKSGVGIAPLPVPYATRESDLKIVVESEPGLNFPFFLVIHRDTQRVRRVRAFLDLMTAERASVRRVLEGRQR